MYLNHFSTYIHKHASGHNEVHGIVAEAFYGEVVSRVDQHLITLQEADVMCRLVLVGRGAGVGVDIRLGVPGRWQTCGMISKLVHLLH